MHKYVLILLSLIAVSFSQTTIPPPTEIATFTTKTFPDNSVYLDQSLTVGDENPPGIYLTQNVGDFDGDGADEIYITWVRNLNQKYKKVNGTDINSYEDFYQSCLYSVKKGTYLINGPFATSLYGFNDWPETVITGDFTGDGNVDFQIGDKVYSTSTPIVKKK